MYKKCLTLLFLLRIDEKLSQDAFSFHVRTMCADRNARSLNRESIDNRRRFSSENEINNVHGRRCILPFDPVSQKRYKWPEEVYFKIRMYLTVPIEQRENQFTSVWRSIIWRKNVRAKFFWCTWIVVRLCCSREGDCSPLQSSSMIVMINERYFSPNVFRICSIFSALSATLDANKSQRERKRQRPAYLQR